MVRRGALRSTATRTASGLASVHVQFWLEITAAQVAARCSLHPKPTAHKACASYAASKLEAYPSGCGSKTAANDEVNTKRLTVPPALSTESNTPAITATVQHEANYNSIF